MRIPIKNIVSFLEENDMLISHWTDTNTLIEGFSSIFKYRDGTVTFISNDRSYEDVINDWNRNITLVITNDKEPFSPSFHNQICVYDPKRAFFAVLDEFFNSCNGDEIVLMSKDPAEYSKWSRISSKARIGKNVKIGTGCVIEGNVTIGDDSEIHHNVVIRRNTQIGNRCTIFSGTVIGERGFNYTCDVDGIPHMIEHYGGVVIEDDVHIGDNCCIIQGMIDDTIIRSGAKLNTMVHLAHNSIIGRNTMVNLWKCCNR